VAKFQRVGSLSPDGTVSGGWGGQSINYYGNGNRRGGQSPDYYCEVDCGDEPTAPEGEREAQWVWRPGEGLRVDRRPELTSRTR
jgi:hypothetical protein